MKIGIDVRPVRAKMAGIGTYTQYLVNALDQVAPESFSFILYGEMETAWERLPLNARVHHRILPSGLRWHLEAARACFCRDIELYHSPSSLFVPLFAAKWLPTVLTVHDLVPFLFPDTSSLKTLLTHRVFRLAVHRAARLIAVSENTRRDLETVCGGAVLAKADVVLEAGRPAFQPTSDFTSLVKYGINGDFLLFVGTIEPRKNLPMLLRAYERASREEKLPPLLLVGKEGWKASEVWRTWESLSCKDSIRFLGYLPDSELPSLLSASGMFLYPSRYEGFGLPVLEAMQCGAPVIASRTSSLPEVAGDAAVLVEPAEAPFAEAIVRLQRSPDLRRWLAEVGKARARNFTWQKAASRTLEIYGGLRDGNLTGVEC